MKIFIAISIAVLLFGCNRSEQTKVSSPATEKFNAFVANLKGAGDRLGRDADDDMSSMSFVKALKMIKDKQAQLMAFDTTQLKGDDLLDWKFAHSILAGKEMEQNRMLWKKDPRLYMTFTNLSALITRPGDDAQKVSDLSKKLLLASRQMQNGMAQLETYVQRYQELGVFMAENGLVFFDKELAAFVSELRLPSDSLKQAADLARKSLVDFTAFIKNTLPKKPAGDFAIGREAYNEMLKNQILLEFDADSLYRFGLYHFEKTVKQLESIARKINPNKTWQQLAVEIKNEYPDPHQMIEVHQHWVDKCREHILKNNLIPIPWKERVKVVARAEYLRKTSYYGHFNFATEKDADSIFTSEMHINPFEDQWDSKRKQEYLVEHDWGVIMITAPHETYAGHHIQGLYQIHNPRPLRRENSISIFHEGWGLYNEQLFRETGFFPNDKIILRQLQLRLWRIARVIYDVGLHTKKITYDEAIQLMNKKVGFLYWAAQLEVDAATTSPGYFIGYFTGMMEILKMREDYKKVKGDSFTLSGFHEDLLKIGSMPIPLMRKALLDPDPQ